MTSRLLVALLSITIAVSACASGNPGGTPPAQDVAAAPPTQGASPQATAAPPWPTIRLAPYLAGLDEPVFMTGAGDGSGRLFVAEKKGIIKLVGPGAAQPSVFLDIRDRVGSDGSEQGLLGLAFEPGSNGSSFWVNYTKKTGCKPNGACDTVIAQFRTTAGNPSQGDPSSERTGLNIDQPYPNHNGGMLAFGRGGHLFVGVGDGGSAGDPQRHAQDPGSLLGKILELDVSGAGPPRVSLFALGVRNPWRFSFDRATGDMFIGDVGQDAWEEVDRIGAGSGPDPVNLGWNVREGGHCYKSGSCAATGEAPIAAYPHSDGCSITGGYVYRGTASPALSGVYLYADYCSGMLWGLRAAPAGEWEQTLLLKTGRQVSSFGQDDAGEIYLIDLKGNIYRVEQTVQGRSQFRQLLPLVGRDG